MPRYPEVVQFRAPAGANQALEELAKAEGRPTNAILRDVLAAHLRAAGATPGANVRAAR